VVRDTSGILDFFTFVPNTPTGRAFLTLQQFRPYVLMMNTRAKASIFLAQGKFGEAMIEIERGRDAIMEFFQKIELSRAGLKKLGDRISRRVAGRSEAKRPLSKLEVMQREMERPSRRTLRESRGAARRD